MITLAPLSGLLLLLLGCMESNRPAKATVSGTIEADEVRVASRYGGRVEKIHVMEGESLRKGDDLLAKIKGLSPWQEKAS